MNKFVVKNNFNNYLSFAWNQYKLVDSLVFGVICIGMQVLMYLGAYLKNPAYVGKFSSFIEFLSQLYWTNDFYYLDKGLLILFIFGVTPIRSFLSFKAWNVSVEFKDTGIMYSGEMIPYIDIKRAITVINESIALQYRKGDKGHFKVIPFPGLDKSKYDEIKYFVLEKNPNIYFHEVKFGFQGLTPPRDKNWPKV
jgi:hypothetical protein